MGKITFNNFETQGGYQRKHRPFSTNIGNKPVSGSIQYNADGTSSATIRDVDRVNNWEDIQERSVWIQVGDILWNGDGLGTEPHWDPSSEEIIYRSESASGWMNRSIVAGRVVKADVGLLTLYGENCVFNPNGRPNMDGRTNWTAPAFVAPENESMQDNSAVPWFAIHWTPLCMIMYCITNSVGGGGVRVSFGGTSSSGVSTYPSDVSPGGNLMTSIQQIMQKSNMMMIIDAKTGKARMCGRKYPGGGRKIILPRNYPAVSTLLGSVTNQGTLKFDYGHAAVNRVYGAGATKEFEATILLDQKGWDPALEAGGIAKFTDANFGTAPIVRMANIPQNTQFQTYKDVGRRWIANDAGYWNKHFSNYPGSGYNWGTAVDGGRWYVHRRPLRDRRLKQNPVTGEGYPPILEYRFSSAPLSGINHYFNGWTEFKGKWSLLRDEAGIYIEGPHDYLWHPTYGFGIMRITTAFEGDEPLMPYIAEVHIGNKYDKTLWVTGLDQFRFQKITASNHDVPTTIRDDSTRLADYLKALEDRYQTIPLVTGDIRIPGIDPGWAPGDWVSDVEGLGLPGGAMITSVTYNFGESGFETLLQLGMP